MKVEDNEVFGLKLWIVKYLEQVSEADADVLADFVISLIRADLPDSKVRANLRWNLDGFIRYGPDKFVDDLCDTIRTKFYLSVARDFAVDPGNLSQPQQVSRKQSYDDTIDTAGTSSTGAQPKEQINDRQIKQARRGGNPGRGNNRGGGQASQGMTTRMPGPSPNMHFLAPGGAFSANNPMAMMFAMQAMGIPIPTPEFLAGLPLPQQEYEQMRGGGKTRIDARCKDYDMKGICHRGVNCPFQHDDNQVIARNPKNEYDPNDAIMKDGDMDQSVSNENSFTDSWLRRSGRDGLKTVSSPGSRADFSKFGGNHNRSLATIVVEQIPDDQFSEQAVRDFFSQFGPIEEVTMHAYKHLALVKFNNYDSAHAAYDSPKPVFDNRFVKIYWYPPNTMSTPTPDSSEQPPAKRTRMAQCPDQGNVPPHNDISNATPLSTSKPKESLFNREKIERDNAAAQKKQEHRKALQAQNKAKLAEVERAKAELALKQAELKRRLEEKLQAKGRSLEAEMATEMAVDSGNGSGGAAAAASGAARSSTKHNTEALQAQLNDLEDEARSLGINLELELPTYVSAGNRNRGRGFRGGRAVRGSYRGGRGSTGRGGGSGHDYRGRWSAPFRGAMRGGSYNLDNRPKKIRVSGANIEFTNEHEEALKEHLLAIGEFESVRVALPERASILVSFKDRFTADKFWRGPRVIPSVGTEETILKFSWEASDDATVSSSSSEDSGYAGVAGGDEEDKFKGGTNYITLDGQVDVEDTEGPMSGPNHIGDIQACYVQEEAEMDLDVAEDDPRVIR